MRFYEFITELEKKPLTPPEPPYAWAALNNLKKRAHYTGQHMANRLQLFMPRPSSRAQTRIDRNRRVMKKPWAWNDEGDLKPDYRQWIDQAAPGVQTEAAPILKPGRAESPPGNNKPQADLWTSTAHKKDNNTYTSDWVEWVKNNLEDWFNPEGYLYRIKPGALILSLDNDYDANNIMRIFKDLDRVQPSRYQDQDHDMHLLTSFPWDQIARHFDAVHHTGYGDGFVYGWDVESTAWLNTAVIQLIGKVKIEE